MIKITVRGADLALLSIKSKRASLDNLLRASVRTSGLQVEKAAKENCPAKTGNLRRSILSQESQEGRTFKATVGPDIAIAPYAVYVETGHTQQPGRYVPALGKRLVASWVEGKWYMAKTAIQMRKKVEDNLKTAFRRALITK